MRKYVPLVYALIFSALSAVFIHGFIMSVSWLMFSDRTFFTVSALTLAAGVAAGVLFFCNLSRVLQKEQYKSIFIFQSIVFLVTLLPFWYFAEKAFKLLI